MEKYKETLEKLEKVVKGGQEYLEKSETLALGYVTHIVCPALRGVLRGLHLRIEERHKVDEKKEEFVIHYTSIAALVSMLQDASKEPEHEDKEMEKENKEPEPEPTPGDKKSSLRLYDSVHLNDPEEGSLLLRNLPRKYDWLLGKREESHAYIASFIMPDSIIKRDDLAFWCVYGMDGEGCSLLLQVPCRRLQKVLYGVMKVKYTVKLLRPVLDSLEPLVRIRKSPIRERVRKILSWAVWEYLEKIRYLYKSEAYKRESEYRFVVAESDISDKDKICFKDQDQDNSPARIRHYYVDEDLGLEVKNLLVTGSLITLGPCVSHPYNVKYFLKTLMRRANLYGPEIKFSKIPYRKS